MIGDEDTQVCLTFSLDKPDGKLSACPIVSEVDWTKSARYRSVMAAERVAICFLAIFSCTQQ